MDAVGVAPLLVPEGTGADTAGGVAGATDVAAVPADDVEAAGVEDRVVTGVMVTPVI